MKANTTCSVAIEKDFYRALIATIFSPGYEEPNYAAIRQTAVDNQKMVAANRFNVETELLLVPPEDFGKNQFENMILATYNYVVSRIQ